MRLLVWPESGAYEIQDKRAGVSWRSSPYQPRFGEVTASVGGKPQRLSLAGCEIKATRGQMELTWRPLAGKEARLQVRIRLVGSDTLEFDWQADLALKVDAVRLLDDALWVTDQEAGYVIVPVREGLLVPADSGRSFTHRFDTFAYEGCHMEMLGLVKSGAAALVTWRDPYVLAELRSAVTNSIAGARQVLSVSLGLRHSARAFRLHLLGRGDYVTIAQAYRQAAKEKGWLVTWDTKLKKHPERAQYFGAVNYKLWSLLSRRMNEESTQEEAVKVNWTFDEAAQVAEHLKNDLKLEKVLFMIGGWIRRGYDNQHPDILPAAPECGGDAGLADCARRVRELGYVFCLHDNYQDIYRDSPSWGEQWVNKNPDGSLTRGGKWAGGRAYITCAQMAFELARRPQNLPAVKKLTGASSYFIDTTYAAGLYECCDRVHPMTRADDMKWKQALSDYARELFGSFGSECGREWAIPYADFFEGLTGVSGDYYHNKDLTKNLGATVVPLFELVYRDCIAMYGKYGYDFSRAGQYVLHHISLGRPLHYHSIPPHLYWQGTNAGPVAAPGEAAAMYLRADTGWAEGMHGVDRFVKNTYEILSPFNELTARVPMTGHEFLTADRKVQRSVFGSGKEASETVVNLGEQPFLGKTKEWGEVLLPPNGFVIESPTFVAFCARSWQGVQYDTPTLFTLRSGDGRALTRAASVRVFHGFGDPRLRFGDAIHRIPREETLQRARQP